MRYSFRLPTLHFMTAYVALGLFGGSFPDTDPTIPFTPFPEYKPNTFTPFNAYVKFADYYGKIRRIMLHKPKITGQSTHPTSETCNASSEGASDPDIGAYALESETTPDASVNHFMAVKLVILKQFVAVLETFAAKCRAKHSIVGLYSIQTTYCRNMAHKSYSLPKYAFTFGFISAI